MDELMEYFEARQLELAKAHHGEYVLIQDTGIVGFYPTVGDAYWYAVDEAKLTPGKFLIRECVTPDEEQPAIFYSRVR